MPFVPVANTARVEVRMVWDSQHVENTLWFRHDVGVTTTTLGLLVLGVSNYWIDNMLPLISDQVQLVETYGRDMTEAAGIEFSLPPAIPSFGEQTGAALPNNTSLTISFRTGLAGRSFRGRNYWVGLTEPAVVANSVLAGSAGLIQTAYQGMVGLDAVADGWTWVVASLFSGGLPRVSGVATEISAALIVDLIVDSQRRRLPGRGA